MTEFELRNRIHDVVAAALSDEGVLSFDQTTAIGRAVLGAIDVLLEVGAIVAPPITRQQERDLVRVEHQVRRK